MIRAAGRCVGLTLAALAAGAALVGCEPRATPAQIRSEPRSQATLSTGPSGPTGAATPGQTGPVARGTPTRPVDRRRGRRGAAWRRGAAR
jgi:hypothetical protein